MKKIFLMLLIIGLFTCKSDDDQLVKPPPKYVELLMEPQKDLSTSTLNSSHCFIDYIETKQIKKHDKYAHIRFLYFGIKKIRLHLMQHGIRNTADKKKIN